MLDDAIVPYEKDVRFEDVLTDANRALEPLELEYIAQFDQPQLPVVLIAGPQRSGTSLLMQLLIACFNVGYSSNLMARFWKAPYIGALLYRELHRKQRPRLPDFSSELGTTYGYEGPHEFGYFWQHWFPYNETHQTSDEDLAKMDIGLLRKELAALENVFGVPLVFKNPIVFSLNIEALADILPTAVFLICHRNPLYVAQSTLESRLEFHRCREQWFSVKPREYLWLRDLPYPEQIAGQIYHTQKRIQDSLAQIDPHRYLRVRYEDLCGDPEKELERVHRLLTETGHRLARTGYRPSPFRCMNVQRIDDGEFRRLQNACDEFWKGQRGCTGTLGNQGV